MQGPACCLVRFAESGPGGRQLTARTELYFRCAAGATKTLLVVPGNPGQIGYYQTFMDTVFDRVNAPDSPHDVTWNVVGISHAGHAFCDSGKHHGHDHHRMFTLEDQIAHKLAFVETFLPRNHEVVVAGHSIGAFIGIKMFKRQLEAREAADDALVTGTGTGVEPSATIIHTINLFPTIRHIHRGMAPFVKFAILPGVRQMLGMLLHHGPRWLIKLVLSRSQGLTDEAKYITESNANYHVCNNVLGMAWIEACDVVDIDEETHDFLTSHIEKCHFLYGVHDNYAPPEFCDHLKSLYPAARTEIAAEHIAHAFCLQSGIDVGITVSGYMHEILDARTVEKETGKEVELE